MTPCASPRDRCSWTTTAPAPPTAAALRPCAPDGARARHPRSGHGLPHADGAARRPGRVEAQRRPAREQQHHGGAEQEAAHLGALRAARCRWLVVGPLAQRARPRRVDHAVPHRGHAADDGGAHQHQHEGRAVGGLEHADHALVAREQPRHAARRGRVHREQLARHVDHAQQPPGAGHVDAVVVLGLRYSVAKWPPWKCAASAASPPTSAVARVVVALGLEDALAVDGAELADRAVHRAHQVGLAPAAAHRASARA